MNEHETRKAADTYRFRPEFQSIQYTSLLAQARIYYKHEKNLTHSADDFVQQLQTQFHFYPAFLKNYTISKEGFGGFVRDAAYQRYAHQMTKKTESQPLLAEYFAQHLLIVSKIDSAYPEGRPLYAVTRQIFEMIADFAAPEEAILREKAEAGAYRLYGCGSSFSKAHNQYIEELFAHYDLE